MGRLDYFRQLIFLIFTPISILLFGLHLVGSYGLTNKSVLACSACYVVVSAVALIVYIVKGPKKLKYIMSALLFALIIIQNVRLLVLASSGFHNSMLTTINISVCYIIVLEASISIIPHISLVGTCINIISMFICRYLTDNSMYSQLLVIFGLMSVTTTVFGFVANKLLHEQKMELNDYANTIEQILHMFA